MLPSGEEPEFTGKSDYISSYEIKNERIDDLKSDAIRLEYKTIQFEEQCIIELLSKSDKDQCIKI